MYIKNDVILMGEVHSAWGKETIQHGMDVECWRAISDHLRDYWCQVESLAFQCLDADFFASEICFTGDKFKRRSKSLF